MWCIPCIPYLPHPRPKISVHVEELRVQSHNLGPHLGPFLLLLLVIYVIVQILLLILILIVDVVIGVVNIVLGSSDQALLVVVAPQTIAPLGVSVFCLAFFKGNGVLKTLRIRTCP